MKRVISIAVLAVMAAVSLTACKATEPFQDAPVSTRDKAPAEVYDMPDGFSNFAEKCDHHGNRVIVAFHSDGSYAAMAVVPADPSCKG